jgi:hypothetical protein
MHDGDPSALLPIWHLVANLAMSFHKRRLTDGEVQFLLTAYDLPLA